ncbi:hypothetical protein FRC09_004895 [Ceratobasidium sp. 395]|nr:hypothetical protein FRC09_004895 [Ceratobasidium sp. 395]
MSTTSVHAKTSNDPSPFPEEDLRFDTDSRPGYFPVWLGQALPSDSGRYIIVRKLGWGQYSSVWLARDLELNRFVSLKILTCKATSVLKSGHSDEINFLQKLVAADRSHPGSRHVLEYHDTFEFDGPSGQHRCVVTEALGPSVSFLRKHGGDGDLRLPLSLVKAIVKSVLLALDYIHESCNIVHTDLKPDNILLRPDDLPSVVATDMLLDPSRTYKNATTIRPAVVPVLSQVLSFTAGDDDPDNQRVEAIIADFGHSHWRDRHFQEHVQPYALRAPEVILGCGWDSPVDIWSVGCLTAELMTGDWLFNPNAEPTWSLGEDRLARMTETLEEQFPLDMIKKGKNSIGYFHEDGTFAHFTTHAEPNRTFRALLTEFSLFPEQEEEIQDAVKFLKRCLRLRPEDRASARDLADDPWLN